MKIISNLTLLAMLVIVISSCEKPDENLPFNQLSEEANKQLVETSAIEAAKAFGELKDEPAVEASVSIGMLFDIASPLDDNMGKKSKVTSTLELVAGLDSDETSINDIYASMKSPGELAEDPESIQDIWDMVVGTYSWNFNYEQWDITDNPDAIVFEFPSTEDGTSNDATLTVSNYTGVTISNPLEDDYNGDLPASLNMNMDVGGTSVMSFTFAVEYNSDGIPSLFEADLTIGGFVLSGDATNNDEEVSASSSFTKDGDIIIEISGGVNGDFTQENIDVDAEEVFHTANIKFQLFNISIGGEADIKALVSAIDSIYPDDYWDDMNFDDKAAAEQEAEAINEHLNIRAIDEDSKKKIADVEAYVVEDAWDGYVDYWVDFRLVFGDGSLVDLETYFEQGFEDFVAEINSIISDLNAEYELGIEPIDY
jgi:hypothetical protein